MRLISDILHSSAERFPEREAVRDPEGSVTYGELAGGASAVAGSLCTSGVKRGDRVAVLLPNGISFIRSHFGILFAGAISVPCDYGVRETTLRTILADSAASVLITDELTRARLGILPPTVRVLTPCEMASAPRRLPEPHDESEVACLMYTTGATGEPKGVILTHANILAALRNIQSFIGYTSSDREVVVLPLSHNFGLGHVYCNLMHGGAVYTEHGLSRVGRVLKALESFGATGFPGTPLGYGLLIDRYAKVLAEKGKGLRFIVINSAPLPPERAAQIRELLPNTDLMVYYGLTEASRSTFISLTKKGPSHYHSVGRPLGTVETAILAPDGSMAARGDEGQIVIKGPTVTPGYWGKPEETEKVLRQGWLHTGDLGRVDEEGNLFVTGRLKEMINVGGLKVNPIEVDRVLGSYVGLTDAAVAGVTGLPGFTGEAVIAGYVRESQTEFNPDDCARHCLRVLEKYKVPVRFVELGAIPRSGTGKILRKELASALRQRLSEASI